MKTNIERYESVGELASTLLDKKSLKHWGTGTRERDNDKWAGDNFKNAFDKLANGDAANAAKIKAQAEILAKNDRRGAPRLELSVVGCVPSVPNYLRGVPKAMLNVRREPKRKPVIDMYIDATIYDGINTDKVAAVGAKLANIIASVEQAGVRVNLYSVMLAKDGADVYGFIVKIKNAHSPLNLLNIAYPIMNRSFCRKVLIHWIECNVDRYVWGHGHVLSGDDVVKNIGRMDGVFFSVTESLDTPLKDMEKKVNDYLNKK